MKHAVRDRERDHRSTLANSVADAASPGHELFRGLEASDESSGSPTRGWSRCVLVMPMSLSRPESSGQTLRAKSVNNSKALSRGVMDSISLSGRDIPIESRVSIEFICQP
jgi:hypothetical protein